MFKKISLALIGSLLILNASYTMQSSTADRRPNNFMNTKLLSSASGLFLCSCGTGFFAGRAICEFEFGLSYLKETILAGRTRATADALARTYPHLAGTATANSNHAVVLHDKLFSLTHSFISKGICEGLLSLACLYGAYKCGRAAINANKTLNDAHKNQKTTGPMILLTHSKQPNSGAHHTWLSKVISAMRS